MDLSVCQTSIGFTIPLFPYHYGNENQKYHFNNFATSFIFNFHYFPFAISPFAFPYFPTIAFTVFLKQTIFAFKSIFCIANVFYFVSSTHIIFSATPSRKPLPEWNQWIIFVSFSQLSLPVFLVNSSSTIPFLRETLFFRAKSPSESKSSNPVYFFIIL
jgi:hypothetical protein